MSYFELVTDSKDKLFYIHLISNFGIYSYEDDLPVYPEWQVERIKRVFFTFFPHLKVHFVPYVSPSD